MKLWSSLRRRQPVQPDNNRGRNRIPPLGVDEYEHIIDYVFSEEYSPASAWMQLIAFGHDPPTVDEKSLLALHALRLTCRLLRSLVDVRMRRHIDLHDERHVDNFFCNLAKSKARTEELPTLVLGIGSETLYLSTFGERRPVKLTSADVIEIIRRSPNLQWLIFKYVMDFNARMWVACAISLRTAGACSQVTRFDFLSLGKSWGVEALISQCFFDLLLMMPALNDLLCGTVNRHDIYSHSDGGAVHMTQAMHPASPPPFRLTTLTIDLDQSSLLRSKEIQRWLLSNSRGYLQSFAIITGNWRHEDADLFERARDVPIPIDTVGSSVRHLHLLLDEQNSGIDTVARCIGCCPELEELAIPLFWHSGELGTEGLTACLDAVHKPLRHFIVVGGSPTGPLVCLIRDGHHALANLKRVTCQRQDTSRGHDALEEVCKEKKIIYRKI